MGTRNLTAVYCDGDYKIAQYGQWDGYPSGQGVTILDFLNKIDINVFKQKLSNVSFADESYLELCDKKLKILNKEVGELYPELSRDTGAEILDIVYSSDDMVVLKNSIDFAGDSLFCEWVYVVDLDKMTFEVYQGFNKDKLTGYDRFFFLQDGIDDEYSPVKKVATFDIDKLPNKEDFLKTCELEKE